ncbi:MAG TPA: hypothetical protein VJ583_10780 [Nitrososphaeraceae archaeon]|jgi:hypothetical protein|nr:hypothetical protein [Nitrososphaeraceae archaeon]
MSSSSNSSYNKNQKVLYQLWTDGKGSFAVRKEKGVQLFEYSYSQQSYSKVIDSKILYDGSITEELVRNWIEELKEAYILDEDGNLIYVEF